MLIYELLTLETPFNDLQPYQVANAVANGEKPILPNLSNEYTSIIEIHNDCIVTNAKMRPSCRQLSSRLDFLLSTLSITTRKSSNPIIMEGTNVRFA